MKNMIYSAAVASLVALGCNSLNEKDFDRTEWIQYKNSDGKIWDEYMEAPIKHNQNNWYLYQYKVREKNNDNLEGTILIPAF